MREATTTGYVTTGAHGSTAAYHDASPRIPVTADAPECDYSRYCVWVPYPDPAAPGGYRWALKSVSARCPAHKELRKSQVYGPRLAPGNGGPAARPPSAPLSVPAPQTEALAAELADED